MKNKLKYLFIALFCISVIFTSSNRAESTTLPNNYKVAVIDIQQLVLKSKEVENLKIDREKKIHNLASSIKKAQEEIAQEKNEASKKALEEKYNKSLLQKRDAIQKEYLEALTKIDKSITSVINSRAKALGYDLVLSKGSILYGDIKTTDITSEIQKYIK